MTSSGTAANRGVLLGAGVLLLGAGAALLVAGLRATGALPAPVESVLAPVDAAVEWSGARGLVLAAGFVPLGIVVAIIAAVLLLVLLIAFLLTRGRRRERTVLRLEGPNGDTAVDHSVAEEILAAPLAERADVLSARVTARRIGHQTALGLVVTPRPGAALGQVLAATDAAVQEWDALTGARMPLVVHVADRGWRELFRSRQRVRRSLAGEPTAPSGGRSAGQTSTPTVGVV